MKAIVLAGGEGKRLKAVTGDLPKPMAPILGKPVMERILELLRAHGITDICATVKYNPGPILDHFGDGSAFGVRLTWSVETEALGTAGGVANCRDFWNGEDFLVISGDAACDFDLTRFVRDHEAHRPAASIALYSHPEPLRYGLALTDRTGRILRFTEKPAWEQVLTNLINTGIYILSPRAMDRVPRGIPYDFGKELFPALLDGGEELRGIIMDGYWCDIGTPRAYYQCCLDALDGRYAIPNRPEEPPLPRYDPPAAPGRQQRRVLCRDRAGVMRAVSSAMLELGADFSDGVVFGDGTATVRIHPDSRESAILVESDDSAAADAFAAFVEKQST